MEKSGLSPKTLQFYNDRRIQLRRIVSSEEAKVTSGKIRFVDGLYINILYIRKFTPCVCEVADDNTLSVAFENEKGAHLKFSANQALVPYYQKLGPKSRPDLDKEKDLFSMEASDIKFLRGNKYTGTLTYNDITYTVRFKITHRIHTYGSLPYFPTLVVRKDNSKSIRIQRRRLRGKRIV